MKKLTESEIQARANQPSGSSSVRAQRIASASKKTVARSAVTGRYVAPSAGSRHPKTTIAETSKKLSQ